MTQQFITAQCPLYSVLLPPIKLNAMNSTPRTSTFAVGLMMVLCLIPAESREKPDINYLRFCQGCHRADGAGSRGNDVPDLRSSVGHFLHLKKGREFVIQVAGVAQAPIPDPELAALMNWTLLKFGASELPTPFIPYNAEEVGELRVNRPTNMSMIRKDLSKELKKLGKAISTN